MRFHVGSIPENPNFVPDEPWIPLREPSPWMMQWIALPIGLMTCGIVVWLWNLLGVKDAQPLLEGPPGAILGCVVAIIFVHELLHAAVHPGFGWTGKSILGFWPSKLLFFAHYEEELTRNRFLWVFAMPLLVITFLPLLVTCFSTGPSVWWAFVSSFNALAACGDMVGMGLIVSQVPSNGIVKNQAWRTYWRLPGTLGSADVAAQSTSSR